MQADVLQLTSELARLTEVACVRVGLSTGSLATVDLGQLMRSIRPGRTGKSRRTTITASFVVYLLCPWNISDGPTEICSWEDARPMMEAGLERLPGRMVQSVDVIGPRTGLRIDFGGLFLRVLPEPRKYVDEYQFLTPEARYSVFADGKIEKEPRESLVALADSRNGSAESRNGR
jgi:hypothetical protein